MLSALFVLPSASGDDRPCHLDPQVAFSQFRTEDYVLNRNMVKSPYPALSEETGAQAWIGPRGGAQSGPCITSPKERGCGHAAARGPRSGVARHLS